MDCNTARLFLQFCRPGTRDLDGPDAAELEAHLAHCCACNAQALDQRRLDQHLGRAMRDVAVPRALRAQILERLETERPIGRPRWLLHLVRAVASAAALLLLVWGWYAFYAPPGRTIVAKDVGDDVNLTPPVTQKRVNDQLRALGMRPTAPEKVDYAYLTGMPAMAILPGTEDWKSPIKVPQLIFTQGSKQVFIYPVPPRYKVEEPEGAAPGYKYQIETYQEPGSTYLVLHTGGDWRRWLYVERDERDP